jgi:mannose-1-phosphate guanylyltransferase
LRPLTDALPKCLVPINGKPLLAHWLDLLLPNGISEVLVNTHYLAEQVRAFRDASPWRDRVTLAYEPSLLGTGGTILKNHTFFGENNPFLVAHADNLTLFSVPAYLRAHARRPREAVMTMMTFETDAPERSGIVELDSRGVVIGFHEKVSTPPGDRANAAVYILEREVVDFMASISTAIVDFSTQVIPHFLGRIATFHNNEYHRDIGTPESLRAAEAEYAAYRNP